MPAPVIWKTTLGVIYAVRFFPRRFWSPHAWSLWKDYVHWRLETYGVYYPEGKFNWKAFKSMLRQMPDYLTWVSDTNATRKTPPHLH